MNSCQKLFHLAGAALLVLGTGEYTGAVTTDFSSTPFRGVTDIHRTVTGANPLDMHIIKISLSDPGISFAVTESNDPNNTASSYDTKAETTLEYIDRVDAQIGTNANFYDLGGIDPFTLNTEVRGLAASNGNVYSPWEDYLYGVNISASNEASLVQSTDPPDSLYYNAVSGGPLLVENGNNVAQDGDPSSLNYRAARTAIGLTANNQLLLFTVDGRQPSYSVGMTLTEVATVLDEFGAIDAVNLDGGGSTTLAFCAPSCGLVNRPFSQTFGPGDRPVGNSLAVFAAPVTPVPYEFSPTLGLIVLGAFWSAGEVSRRFQKRIGRGKCILTSYQKD